MRKTALVVLLLTALWSWRTPHPAQGVGNTFVFPLSVKGKTNQTDVDLPPGSKDVQGKVNDKILTAVLQGTLPDFAAQYLQLDPGGKFYLLYDGRDSWRVATNPGASGVVTTLHGQTSAQGSFWMAGQVSFPMMGPIADGFAVGKLSSRTARSTRPRSRAWYTS